MAEQHIGSVPTGWKAKVERLATTFRETAKKIDYATATATLGVALLGLQVMNHLRPAVDQQPPANPYVLQLPELPSPPLYTDQLDTIASGAPPLPRQTPALGAIPQASQPDNRQVFLPYISRETKVWQPGQPDGVGYVKGNSPNIFIVNLDVHGHPLDTQEVNVGGRASVIEPVAVKGADGQVHLFYSVAGADSITRQMFYRIYHVRQELTPQGANIYDETITNTPFSADGVKSWEPGPLSDRLVTYVDETGKVVVKNFITGQHTEQQVVNGSRGTQGLRTPRGLVEYGKDGVGRGKLYVPDSNARVIKLYDVIDNGDIIITEAGELNLPGYGIGQISYIPGKTRQEDTIAIAGRRATGERVLLTVSASELLAANAQKIPPKVREIMPPTGKDFQLDVDPKDQTSKYDAGSFPSGAPTANQFHGVPGALDGTNGITLVVPTVDDQGEKTIDRVSISADGTFLWDIIVPHQPGQSPGDPMITGPGILDGRPTVSARELLHILRKLPPR